MEELLDEIVSSEDLKKFERVYHEQLCASNVTVEAQFNYAWCLVRSRYPADIRKGIILLEELFSNNSADSQRDCLYYLAIGNARIKEFSKALQYVRAFLQIEPGNQQVQNLESLITKRMEREGLKGIALTGGVALVLGGLVGIGYTLAKISKK